MIKIFTEIVSWLAIGMIALMGLYIITSNYNIFGGYRSYLVQSGSMEPAIMTGDIIVINSQNVYAINDVVTFRDEENRIVTHRLIESTEKDGNPAFATKGDANRSQDFETINYGQILGKVVLVVPKLGYLVAFSKTMPGLIILILIPAFMFVLDELLKINNVKPKN